jgi:hypothetical protein
MNMRWISVLVVGVAATAACGGDDGGGDGDDDGAPTGDTFASGTRLKAVYQDGGGGAVRLARWFDTELDAPCRFAYAPDGVLHCLPTTEFGIQFADAACTQPLALFDPGNEVPDRIVVTELGCPGPIRRGTPYAMGGVHTVASTYIMGADGICQPGGPVTNGVVAHDITVLDETMFAAGEMATVMRDGDGDTQAIRGADGAYEVVNPIDTTGAPCADGSIDGRCAPWAMSYSFGDLFGDASCTQPAAYAVGAIDCPVPAFATVYNRIDGCWTRSVASVGTEVPDENLYESPDGSTCAPPMYARGSRYFALGAAAADPFMHISVVDVGTGRLRARHVANAQGVRLAPEGSQVWSDTQLDIECGVFDGRCIPQRSIPLTGGDAFADAACTQYLFEDSTGCAGTPTVPAWVGASDMNGAIVGVFPVGAPFTGQVYMLTNGTTCEPRAVDPTSRFFAVGAMSGVDVLAAVPEVTDG